MCGKTIILHTTLFFLTFFGIITLISTTICFTVLVYSEFKKTWDVDGHELFGAGLSTLTYMQSVNDN